MFLIDLYWFINKIKLRLKLANEREPSIIGLTKKTMDECYRVLICLGYQWDYFAWEDIGEGISVRKLYDNRQIHIRVFTDGEIRAHDEYNYEYEPLKHYNSESLKEPDIDTIKLIESALDAYGTE